MAYVITNEKHRNALHQVNRIYMCSMDVKWELHSSEGRQRPGVKAA